MLSRFFIDRPIFAWVVAIIIMLFGLLAITRLPIARYPNIMMMRSEERRVGKECH
jgi:multidrug efflux pump